MKLIATRQATVNEIEPGEGITHDGKRYVVDEVLRKREGFTLSCLSEENPSVTRRKTITFTGDEKVTIEAGEADRRKLLDTFQALLADADSVGSALDGHHFDYDAKAGALALHLGTWLVLLEA
jgi:hypothetical protein